MDHLRISKNWKSREFFLIGFLVSYIFECNTMIDRLFIAGIQNSRSAQNTVSKLFAQSMCTNVNSRIRWEKRYVTGIVRFSTGLRLMFIDDFLINHWGKKYLSGIRFLLFRVKCILYIANDIFVICRTLATFFVSSFWHGIHAGYYFSLFSVPLYLLVEDTFQKKVIKTDRSKLVSLQIFSH